MPAGFDSLNVNTIPASELAAINPGAFAKMPMDQMQEAIGLLGSRVVPLVSSGATIDDLRRLDSSEGRTGPVTLARTYELFFGSDAIRVDLKGAAPSVINGRHRIWLARQMGVASLPMRVH